MTTPQHQEPRPAFSKWSGLVRSRAAHLVVTVVIAFAVNAEAAVAPSNERQLRLQNQDVLERVQTPRIIVPSLSGMRPEEATRALSDPRYRRLLSLGGVQQRQSDQAAGTIIDQTPAAGTQAVRPTAIAVVVAQPPPNPVVPSGPVSALLGWLSQPGHWTWMSLLAGALLLVAALASYLRDILTTRPSLACKGYADGGSQELEKNFSIGLSIRILRDPGQQELVRTDG